MESATSKFHRLDDVHTAAASAIIAASIVVRPAVSRKNTSKPCRRAAVIARLAMVAPPRPRRWGGFECRSARPTSAVAHAPAVDVKRGHHHFFALALLQAMGQFGGGGGFPAALQADHQDRRRRRRRQVQRRLGLHLDQIVIDDLDHLLAGRRPNADSWPMARSRTLSMKDLTTSRATSASSKATRFAQGGDRVAFFQAPRRFNHSNTSPSAAQSVEHGHVRRRCSITTHERLGSNPRWTEPMVSWPLLPREAGGIVGLAAGRRARHAAALLAAEAQQVAGEVGASRLKSSTPSPTPMACTGRPNFSVRATTTPPRAVPSNLVTIKPLTSVTSWKASTWPWAFWPTVPSRPAVVGCRRILFGDHAVDFGQFVHQFALVLQPPSGVDKQHVDRRLAGRGERLKATAAASAPGAPAITGTPTRSPQTCNCSTAAARKCRRRRTPWRPSSPISGRICQSWWFCRCH